METGKIKKLVYRSEVDGLRACAILPVPFIMLFSNPLASSLLDSSWQEWQVDCLVQGLTNLALDSEEKIRLFGTNPFSKFSPKKFIGMSVSQRAAYLEPLTVD